MGLSMNRFRSFAKAVVIQTLKAFGLPSSGLRSNWVRMQLAKKHLRGTGIEIGAMHNTLRVPKTARVEYLDVTTREENIRKFPDLDPQALVNVDYLANGFLMDGIASSSFDFVIANHVLEHASNPVGALVQWFRVLKPGGILYCALPRMDITFDKGRKLTTAAHMMEDYQFCGDHNRAQMRERNLDHYREWLSIAIPAHTGQPPPKPDLLAVQIGEYADREEEIHFHTFTMASALELLRELAKSVLPQMTVVQALDARAEILLILKKSPTPQ
jgi:SAM-dependent methyltransferase